jgi:hypothetical protein
MCIKKLKLLTILLLFFFWGAGVWTRGLHLESLHQFFFVEGFFQDRVSQTTCLGWLWTMILLKCFLSSRDYRRELLVPGYRSTFDWVDYLYISDSFPFPPTLSAFLAWFRRTLNNSTVRLPQLSVPRASSWCRCEKQPNCRRTSAFWVSPYWPLKLGLELPLHQLCLPVEFRHVPHVIPSVTKSLWESPAFTFRHSSDTSQVLVMVISHLGCYHSFPCGLLTASLALLWYILLTAVKGIF